MMKAELFIKNHLSLQGKILGLQRTDSYEIPLEAIREALINAVVHRDYSNAGRNIKIGVYDDRIQFTSPGAFPSTLNISDVFEGRSELRNRVLARVLKELNYIEQWGTGIQRIRNSCKKAGLSEPKIEERGDFVVVELYRKQTEQVSEQVDRQKAVLDFCKSPKAANEIMSFLKLKHREYFRANILKPLLENKQLFMMYPDKPKSSKQKYYSNFGSSK